MTACAVGAQRPPGLRENVIRPVVAGMNEHSVAVGVPILQPLRLLPFAEDAAILGRDADIDKTVIESGRSEEHTSELQSLMRISYDDFRLKTKKIDYLITLHSPSSVKTSTHQSTPITEHREQQNLKVH